LIDPQGAPEAGIDVALVKDGAVVAAARTDTEGRFALADMKAGVYQLQTPRANAVCRVWAPNTAPPVAQPGVLLVSSQNVVRQQSIFSVLANPWVLGGIVAAAIAIPLALDDDDDDSAS
jgi:hypothetical protein